MKRQSNRIKADRKPSSSEHQASSGVGNQITWEPEEHDGSLIRHEGNSFFLLETGEELEELILIHEGVILMSKGGRLFLRNEIEEYFDGKQWRIVGDDGKPTNRRRMGNLDQEITPASARKKPEIDGSLIRREGSSLFLLETGEQLDELDSSGPEELLMSKGRRFFFRVKHEEYFDGKQWRSWDGSAKLKNPRRNICQDREITQAAAIRWLLDNSIPSQMWGDFSQPLPTDIISNDAFEALDVLDDKVALASGVLFLISQELARELEDTWPEKGSEATGIVNLGLNTAEALNRAIEKYRQACLRGVHRSKADAA